MGSTKKEKKRTFEQSMQRLEQIVEDLENGGEMVYRFGMGVQPR